MPKMSLCGKKSENFEISFIHFNKLKHLKMFQIKNRVTHFNAWAMQIVLAAKTAQRLLGGHTPLYTLLILKCPSGP